MDVLPAGCIKELIFIENLVRRLFGKKLIKEKHHFSFSLSSFDSDSDAKRTYLFFHKLQSEVLWDFAFRVFALSLQTSLITVLAIIAKYACPVT